MKKALELAKISYKNFDVPVGCVIVKDKKIIKRRKIKIPYVTQR